MLWKATAIAFGIAALVLGSAVVESERKERRALYLFLFIVAGLVFLGTITSR